MREVQTLAFAVRRWRIANTLPKILWKRPAVGRAAAAARGPDSVSGRPSRDARPCRSSRPRHALRRRRRRPSGERERERERERSFSTREPPACVCARVCVCVYGREREREREREQLFYPGAAPEDARRRPTAPARSEAEPRACTAARPPASAATRSRPPRPPPPPGRGTPASRSIPLSAVGAQFTNHVCAAGSQMVFAPPPRSPHKHDQTLCT